MPKNERHGYARTYYKRALLTSASLLPVICVIEMSGDGVGWTFPTNISR